MEVAKEFVIRKYFLCELVLDQPLWNKSDSDLLLLHGGLVFNPLWRVLFILLHKFLCLEIEPLGILLMQANVTQFVIDLILLTEYALWFLNGFWLLTTIQAIALFLAFWVGT